MGLTNEHVGSKIVAKIKIYILTRAELLINLCYEIPCSIGGPMYSRETPFFANLTCVFLNQCCGPSMVQFANVQTFFVTKRV